MVVEELTASSCSSIYLFSLVIKLFFSLEFPLAAYSFAIDRLERFSLTLGTTTLCKVVDIKCYRVPHDLKTLDKHVSEQSVSS